jgi:outer membrane receptor for ferrienterochelin and colicins
VINLFTEDHAAMSGSRILVIEEKLKPEQSWNAGINWNGNFYCNEQLIQTEISAFYNHFSNRIMPDYLTDGNKVIYRNLNGYSYTRGLQGQIIYLPGGAWEMRLGAQWMESNLLQENVEGTLLKQPVLMNPNFTGNIEIEYPLLGKWTGALFVNHTGIMYLPIQQNDFRSNRSSPYQLVDIKFERVAGATGVIFFSLKNIFDFLPNDPIMRPFDPFDKEINEAEKNPNGYTFDTTYNYAPMLGRRIVIGCRLNF